MSPRRVESVKPSKQRQESPLDDEGGDHVATKASPSEAFRCVGQVVHADPLTCVGDQRLVRSVVGCEINFPLTEERTMPTQIALHFRSEIESIHAALLALSPELARYALARGRMDAQADRRTPAGFGSQQPPALCARLDRRQLHRAGLRAGRMGGCARILRPALGDSARWWKVEHEILAAVVDRIPEERLEASCMVGDNAPVTLRFLVEDYIRHQRWHLAQLTAAGCAVGESAESRRKKARREPGSFACLSVQVTAATWLPFSQGPSLLPSSQEPSWQLPSSPGPSWQLPSLLPSWRAPSLLLS